MRFLMILACCAFSTKSLAYPNLYMRADTLDSDTLVTDPLSKMGDTLMLTKIQVIEEELETISETLSELAEEEENDALLASKKKIVHFGLSLGYRWLTNSSSRQNELASVSPIDSTLRLTTLDRTSYLFSTSVVFDLNLGKFQNPDSEANYYQRRLQKQEMINERRNKKEKQPRTISTQRGVLSRFLVRSADRLCIVSNLNILDFSNGQKELAFNKSIEGGLGIGYRLNDSMYVGLNWEHMQSLQLYDDIKRQQGKKVELNGSQLVSSSQLDPEDEDLYFKKNLSGWGIKMIICL